MIPYKRGFKTHYKYKHVLLIEPACDNKKYVYHYFSLQTALKCFNVYGVGTVRFVEPSSWSDKYERRFYCAPYPASIPYNMHPRLFAFCTTAEKECAPSWISYLGVENQTIQLVINRVKWLKILNNYAKKNGGCFYEGLVNYGLTDHHISVLHLPTEQREKQGQWISYPVKGHTDLFKPFSLESYLSLLLIKRDAFSFEREIRYLYIPSNDNYIEEAKFIEIDWTDVVEEIRVQPNISGEDYAKLNKIFRGKVKRYDINSDLNIPIQNMDISIK